MIRSDSTSRPKSFRQRASSRWTTGRSLMIQQMRTWQRSWKISQRTTMSLKRGSPKDRWLPTCISNLSSTDRLEAFLVCLWIRVNWTSWLAHSGTPWVTPRSSATRKRAQRIRSVKKSSWRNSTKWVTSRSKTAARAPMSRICRGSASLWSQRMTSQRVCPMTILRLRNLDYQSKR